MQPFSTVESVLSDAVTASSRERMWPGIEVMSARIGGNELAVDGLDAHTLALNCGRAFRVDGRIDGRRSGSLMAPGMLKLVAAGPRSQWTWDGDEPIEMLHVSVADDALRGYAAELEAARRPELPTRVGVDDRHLAQLARLLAGELESRFTRSLVADSLRLELIARLLGAYSSLGLGAAPRTPAKRLGLRALRRLDEYIDASLGLPLSIGELAAVCGMSRFHFARLFRATVGRSPHQYVLERRLERARDLLRFDTVALSDVATATGFADQSHLTREVKRRFGVTPAVLRAS